MVHLIPPGEALDVVFRTVVIFSCTFLLIRLRGTKQLAQMSLFDALLVIALGSALGDVMVYPESDVPLLRAVVAIGTLVLLVYGIEYFLARSSKKIATIVHGEAVLLVKDGKLLRENLEKANLTEGQLRSKLREKNIKYFSQARLVQLEPDGELSVERKVREKKE